ncbi:hypothetical protein B0H19DRAFT_1229439, partial [Mycena capillaripes]
DRDRPPPTSHSGDFRPIAFVSFSFVATVARVQLVFLSYYNSFFFGFFFFWATKAAKLHGLLVTRLILKLSSLWFLLSGVSQRTQDKIEGSYLINPLILDFHRDLTKLP